MTSHGGLSGERVVVATHYPFWDRALYFARLEAMRSAAAGGAAAIGASAVAIATADDP